MDVAPPQKRLHAKNTGVVGMTVYGKHIGVIGLILIVSRIYNSI
jgi:hypothetical protein